MHLITVRISSEDHQWVTACAGRHSTNKSAVVKQALNVLRYVDDIRSGGGRLIVEKDGKSHELLLV